MTKLTRGFLAALVTTAGCHPGETSAPPASAAPPGDHVSPETVDGQIAAAAAAVKGARYALEPPRNRAQMRDAASVPRIAESTVRPEWIMLQIAAMQEIAGNASLPNAQRAQANVLAASAEGLLIEHFTTMFWNKAEPGRRVIAALRSALEQDPHNEAAAVAYTFSLLGIRNSAFRSQAEETMGVETSAELAQIATLLAQHGDSLLAQSLLREVLVTLATDGPPSASTEQLRAGLDQRIVTLRARDADETENVDDQLRRYAK